MKNNNVLSLRNEGPLKRNSSGLHLKSLDYKEKERKTHSGFQVSAI